jgi:long-chain acyl-CoA synthetase
MALQVAAIPPVPAALDRALSETPHAEALVDDSVRLTYARLDAAVKQAAAGLAGLGARPGDRVAASAGNGSGLVVAFLAAMRLGAIWVGINPALAPAEVEYLLDDSGTTVFIGGPDRIGRSSPGARLRVDDAEELIAAGAGLDPPEVAVDAFAPAAIAYTSGTTGRPKGAVHSQYNMMVVATGAAGRTVPSASDRVGVCLPLALLNLMILGPLSALWAGAACVVSTRRDPAALVKWAIRERVTTMAVVPTILHDIVAHPDVDTAALFATLRPTVGGADCPPAWRRLFAEHGLDVNQTYGLTEAPTTVTAGHAGQPDGSSGKALPHIRISVRDAADSELPPGEAGEICIEPTPDGVYRTMLGYWGQPEATAVTLRGGVLHTGDVGCLDASGFLYVHDRGDDLILRGGANVYPAEVERVLAAHPGVAGVAVVGVPDERLGQRVVAAVEPSPGSALSEDILLQTCAAGLARYKVPDRIAIVDSLPRTSMGKVRRNQIRSLFFQVPSHTQEMT